MNNVVALTCLWTSAHSLSVLAQYDACETDISSSRTSWRAPLQNMLGLDPNELESYLVQAHGAMESIPALEMCLASYDTAQVMQVLLNVLGSCASVASLATSPTVKELTASLEETWKDMDPEAPLPLKVSDLPSNDDVKATMMTMAMKVVRRITNDQVASICSILRADVVPCLTTTIATVMESLTAHSNTCCDPWMETITETLGDSLENVMMTLIPSLVDTMCDTRSPGFSDAPSQTCGYTFLQTLAANDEPWHQLAGLAQLPNDHACAAHTGDTWSLSEPATEDTTWRFGDKTKGITMDSCAIPIDAFVSMVAEFPIMTTHPLWSKLIGPEAPGIKGQELLKFWESSWGDDSESSQKMDAMLNNPWGDKFKVMNFHIPSGFADTCVFKSSILDETALTGTLTSETGGMAAAAVTGATPLTLRGGNNDPEEGQVVEQAMALSGSEDSTKSAASSGIYSMMAGLVWLGMIGTVMHM